MRQFLTIVLPLLAPTLLYFGYLMLARRSSPSGAIREMPWIWLAASGGLLLAVTLGAAALFGGADPSSQYAPPELIDGEVKPGGFTNP